MHSGFLAFNPFDTGGMIILAVLILAPFAWNFRDFVHGFSKSVADFKKARDDFEDHHGP